MMPEFTITVWRPKGRYKVYAETYEDAKQAAKKFYLDHESASDQLYPLRAMRVDGMVRLDKRPWNKAIRLEDTE